MNYYMLRILQLMPAEGWYARYKDSDEGFGFLRLICWALVENPEEDPQEASNQYVEGMTASADGDTEFCGTFQGFAGYIYRPDWKEMWIGSMTENGEPV